MLMFDWQPNRSMLATTVIPELAYPDVLEASEWLCRVFGFAERLRIGNHRVQLAVGSGAVIVTKSKPGQGSDQTHALLVRVTDVDRHYEQVKAQGAKILEPPAIFRYGERQYNVEDLGGHFWTFSQTVTDIDPADWGGTLV
jgi:uncharacterized glyoxalase superfamily protein PhnB